MTIDRLVRIELLQGLGDLLSRHRLQHLVAHALIELGKRRGIEIAAQSSDQRFA